MEHVKTWLPIQGGAEDVVVIQGLPGWHVPSLAMFVNHVRMSLAGEITLLEEMVNPLAKTWLPIQIGALTTDVIQRLHRLPAQCLAKFAQHHHHHQHAAELLLLRACRVPQVRQRKNFAVRTQARLDAPNCATS